MIVKRGDIFYADLNPVVGSEQDGIRPILIVQNDMGNTYSPTIIGVAITTKAKPNLPTHIPIEANKYGLSRDSMILVEQVRTLDKSRLKEKIGVLDELTMDKVKQALKISFNLRASFIEVFGDW
ncbi:MAG: type II toxin-antitoxin system PemK/MazF family toxin [Clostridia bacterium]